MPLPEGMRAVEIGGPGPPEVLRVVQRPLPVPHAGEVLIQVAAAGVNRPDCLQRRGLYPPPPGASDLPGLEVAGVIAACARDVDDWHAGDRVCALLTGGGYAGYCSVPAVQCLPVPPGMTLVEAAALPEALFTVWAHIFERGGLRAGETLLVHGGASGIGTTAIQLGAAFGACVIATAGTAEKAALCLKLGAERAINYRIEEFGPAVREHTGGRGVDVILDMVGGRYLEANIAALAEDGRLVVIGLLGGAAGTLDLAALLKRRLTVTGATLRARPVAEKARIARALRDTVWPLLASRRVVPVIQQVLPLEAAARAHQILESNQSMGKIVLLVNADL